MRRIGLYSKDDIEGCCGCICCLVVIGLVVYIGMLAVRYWYFALPIAIGTLGAVYYMRKRKSSAPSQASKQTFHVNQTNLPQGYQAAPDRTAPPAFSKKPSVNYDAKAEQQKFERFKRESTSPPKQKEHVNFIQAEAPEIIGKCPHCGTDIEEGTIFCFGCGEKI